MKKIFSIPVAACLFLLFTFFFTSNASCQTNENNNTASETTVKTAPAVRGITQGRAKSLGIGALGLVAMILAFVANKRLSRSPVTSQARVLAIAALLMALACVVLSAAHIYNASGAFGTGTGKAGAIVSLIVGVITIIISSLALRRKNV